MGRGTGIREQNKETNRSAILSAAPSCFIAQGFDAVTVRDVIRRTDLASGTFYNYFNDKEELLREILRADVDDLNRSLHAARAAAGTVERFLEAAYLALFGKIRAEPVFFALLLRNEHVVRTLFSDTVVDLPMRLLEGDLADAIARDVFPDVDVGLLSAAFYGVGFEIGRTLMKRPDLTAEASAAFATRLLTRGVSGIAHLPLLPASDRQDEAASRS